MNTFRLFAQASDGVTEPLSNFTPEEKQRYYEAIEKQRQGELDEVIEMWSQDPIMLNLARENEGIAGYCKLSTMDRHPAMEFCMVNEWRAELMGNAYFPFVAAAAVAAVVMFFIWRKRRRKSR